VLHQAGAALETLNARKMTPLVLAADKVILALADYFLSVSTPEAQVKLAFQVIRQAVQSRHYELADALVPKFCKEPAPFYYIKKCYAEPLKQLLGKGIDLEMKDPNGMSLLDHAAQARNVPVLQALLKVNPQTEEKVATELIRKVLASDRKYAFALIAPLLQTTALHFLAKNRRCGRTQILHPNRASRS